MGLEFCYIVLFSFLLHCGCYYLWSICLELWILEFYLRYPFSQISYNYKISLYISEGLTSSDGPYNFHPQEKKNLSINIQDTICQFVLQQKEKKVKRFFDPEYCKTVML